MTGRHWGRVIGHARNHENRHQQHRENQSAHVAMTRALSMSATAILLGATI